MQRWKTAVAAIGISTVMSACGGDQSPPGRYVVTDDNTPGCQSADTFDRIETYAYQGDKRMASDLLSKSVASGLCDLFREGEIVHLMESGLGKAKVRRQGSAIEYWVSTNYIDRQ